MFGRKSSKIPSCKESLKIISLELITDDARPDGVKGFSQSRHPCNHKLATAVGIEHSIPFDSSMLSRYCCAFEKFERLKKAIAFSFNCVGTTFPLDDAISNILCTLSDNLLNECDDFSCDTEWISVSLLRKSWVELDVDAKMSSGRWRDVVRSVMCVF